MNIVLHFLLLQCSAWIKGTPGMHLQVPYPTSLVFIINFYLVRNIYKDQNQIRHCVELLTSDFSYCLKK